MVEQGVSLVHYTGCINRSCLSHSSDSGVAFSLKGGASGVPGVLQDDQQKGEGIQQGEWGQCTGDLPTDCRYLYHYLQKLSQPCPHPGAWSELLRVKKIRRLLARLRELFSLPQRCLLLASPDKRVFSVLEGLSRTEVLLALYLHFELGVLLVGTDHVVSRRGKRVGSWWMPRYGTRVVALDVDCPLEAFRAQVAGFLAEVRDSLRLQGFYSSSFSGQVHLYFLFRETVPLKRAYQLGQSLRKLALRHFPRDSVKEVVAYPTRESGPGRFLLLPLRYLGDGLEHVEFGYPSPLGPMVRFLEERLNSWDQVSQRLESLNETQPKAPSRARALVLLHAKRDKAPLGEPSSKSAEVESPDALPPRSQDPSHPLPSEDHHALHRGGKGNPVFPEEDWLEQGALEVLRRLISSASLGYVKGSRQNLILGLAGFAARQGVPEEMFLQEVQHLLKGDEEKGKRLYAIRRTYQRARAGREVSWYNFLEGTLGGGLLEEVQGSLERNPDRLEAWARDLGLSPSTLRLALLISAEVLEKASLFGVARIGYNVTAKRYRVSKRTVSEALGLLRRARVIQRVEVGFFHPDASGNKVSRGSAYLPLPEFLQVREGQGLLEAVLGALSRTVAARGRLARGNGVMPLALSVNGPGLESDRRALKLYAG